MGFCKSFSITPSTKPPVTRTTRSLATTRRTAPMRVERAIDAYIDWRRLERDATARSVDSYRRILDKLAEDYPELDLARFTKQDLRAFLKRWENRSAATRANVVSVLHSFFGWATAEDL